MRKTTVSEEQLRERENLYRETEDLMVVHQTAVDAKDAGLPVPEWVIREWTKWSRKLLRARGRGTTLTPPLSATDAASSFTSDAVLMIPRPSRSHWIAAPVVKMLPSRAYWLDPLPSAASPTWQAVVVNRP